ncbi:hypothetical protein LPB72_05260 [Hydrogenophaga crassostreae]|uniref:Uncharacterized protein n=1 Tax=Hydrogenophaga crassostreae TaxID=1763535 RepID=A0A167INL6_9BURK|nr:hypothetical protein [Hydrogenophaga crassostreae]AOW14650.1 hypothetical protein LPB072_19290 [Hydrogenophaga crassostreae]OAD43253.1 hypothetical protein LPB72_05260 [Hydrogenophaga crassostreae]
MHGFALLVVWAMLNLAHRYPPADSTVVSSAALHAMAPPERLSIAPTEGAALPDWVQQRRHQDSAAPWQVDAQGHVVWDHP